MTRSEFIFFILFWGSFSFLGQSQNTVGLLSYEPSASYDGYNLLFPHNQPNVYLLNNCGEIVHSWEDEAYYRPGNGVYLLENGNLVKCKRSNQVMEEPIAAGGKGGIVELRDWDNNLLWSFEQNDSTARLHHDIEPMPNGNILMISWENKSAEVVFEAGRDTSLLADGQLWPDYILEVNPNTDEVVWEWHAWDHLIQDYDSSKANYDVISEHPELIDLNWVYNDNPIADWMHANAIDYNAALDQIVLSVPFFSEVWVIDHSTTTEEAAGHTGGSAGKGGDLIYRWGNPQTYGRGGSEDQKLFFQHDSHWIDQFIEPTHPHYGKMAVFNNRVGPNFSSVNIFNPGFGWGSWSYPMIAGQWWPEDFDLSVTHPMPETFYSGGLSSVQLLPNDNLLMCAGVLGYSVEITPDNEIVWEYKTPITSGAPATQGDTITAGNQTFRMKRYPVDFPAFEGKDLSPKGYIELEPNVDFCDMILPMQETVREDGMKMYPNPASAELVFERDSDELRQLRIFDLSGRCLLSTQLNQYKTTLEVGQLEPGFYLVQIDGMASRKLILSP